MKTDKSNVIPLVDLSANEQPTQEEAMAQGRLAVEAILDRGDSYLMLAMSNGDTPAIDVCCACSDEQVPDMVMTAVSMLGMSTLGPDKVKVIPASMVSGIALSVGLQELHRLVEYRTKAEMARMSPATPVNDLNAPTQGE